MRKHLFVAAVAVMALVAVPVWAQNSRIVEDGGTYMQPHGGDYAKVATAWLKWWLKDDKEAARMFTGSEPGVSKMPGWICERKNIQ